MGRWLALLSTAALVIAAAATDLPETCKRQPFRGRCPSIGGQPPKRSQFVLRYYARNGECVSYPYGHCANDDRELQLFRYKEECEASCLRENGELDAPGNQTSIKEGSEDNQTYGTVPPLKQPPTIASTENQETQATTEEVTSTTTVSTTTSNTPAPTTTTSEPTTVTTTTEKATTTTTTTQEETTTVGTTPSTTVSTTPPPSTTTTEKTSPSTTTTHAPERATVTVHESTNVSDEENTVEEEEDDVKETSPSVTTTTAATTSAPRTECERRRAASSSSKIRGGFVPVCDVNGNFQKVQCEPDNRQCFCVNSAGIEITNSRTRNGSKPDCEKIEAAVTPKTQSCRGPSERGPCSSSFPRFYFDETLQRCVAFTYSGCGGNGNSYETEGDCQRQCAPKPATKPVVEAVKTVQKPAVSESHDVCSLPKERGPCDKYELRFYYNSDTNECKYFFWGGCEGNANNFETAEACHASCGVTKGTAHSTTKATPTSGRITPNAVESKRQPQTNAGMVPGTIPGVRVTPSAEPNGSQTTTTTLPEEGSDEEFIPEEPKIDDEAGPTTTTPVPTTPRVVPRTFPTRPSPSQRLPVATNAPVHPTQAPTEPHIVSRNNNGVFLRPDNRCAHPLDAGTCRGQFVRWYWNDEKKICDVFTYSGCEGNGNNFASKEECFAICHKEPVVVTTAAPDFSNVCKHDVDAGECNGVFQRFAFDNEAGECRPFTYGGCGGNGNNFATIAECRSKCQKTKSQPLNVCEFEIEAGECTGVFPRFAYDRETNDCRPFTYGGCGGNGNNFANINECRNVCIQKSCQAIGQCDTTRCQVVNDSRGCPFCSCSPIKAPPPTAPCPPIDVPRCQEPCLVINNRRGCQECACPKIHSSPIPPVALPPAPNTGAPGSQNEGLRAPATPSVVAPPGTSSHPQPPAPRTPATTAVPRGPLPPSFANEIEEKCHQPLDPGPCKNFDDRWFFNQEDGSCHPFKYGGCAGNRNHFFTQRECEIHCARFLIRREEEFEGDDESVEVEHPRQHGVKEVEVKTPIEVDNYKTPNPPLRGVYGKKNDEPATTQGVKITTTTTAQPTRAARISSTTTASTTVSTSTATTPLVEEKNDDETEAAEEEDATEAATTAVEEPEEFEKDEVESTPEVEEEEPTTVVYTSASSTTVRPTTSTTASSTTTAAAARPSDEEEVVEQTEEEEEHEQEEVEERVSVGNIETTSVAATTVVDETETTNESEVTTAATTAVPDVKTTLFNEIDSMEGDDEVEENEVAPNTMMASSKFAVHRNTEEVKKFEEVENTPKPQKIDEVKAVTLKKVEITRVPPSTTTVPSTVQSTTVAPTTAEPQSTAVPTAETEESVDTSSPVAETTTVARTASTSTSSAAATTTGAPVKTSHIDISTTESTTPVPTTSVRSTTVATTTRGSTASTTEILESDESTEVADIDMTKIIQEGTVLKKDIGVIDPSTPIGREPNPSVATGIGREVQTLPPDVMKDLDEPTTIRPPATPEAPVRPSTASPTTTRAFRTLPQATTITKTNSATHNTRPENFETDPRIICSMPADAGICTNYVARWFYNAHTGQCEQFSYGSCGGNLNNFADRTSCELRCLASHPAIHSQVPERCSQEKDSGEGDGYNVKWYFNMRNLRCEQFVYLGQGGNSNQFETLSDCERFCSPQPTRPPRPTLATAPPTTAPSSPAPHRPETQRPLQELPEITQPTSLSGGDEDYDSSEDNEDTIPDKEFTDISKVDLPTLAPPPRPNAVQQGDGLAVQHPASEPRPPSAQGTKIITEEEVKAPKAQSTAAPTTAATTTTQRPTSSATAPTQGPPQQSKSVYDAQIIKTSDVVYNGRESSIVAASPKQGIDYATGRVIAPGLKNVEGRIPVKDLTSEIDDAKNARPSCPNGKKELLYADGRSVQCLPGWKHCPDKSVCYFNGVDYFCCPNEDDPYDRHVFGGYGGEEERNGYKVFGPLGAGRRLMDDIILPREKRQTSMDRAFNTNPVSFNLDSVVAPLRFDAEKPKHISKAGVMRRVPQKPKHGNPMCILPLVKGDCSAAHLRYYYDRNSDSCRLFYYSGCQGNGNNFGSLEDCQRLCVLGGQIAPAVQTDAVTPATIVAAGQCPSGSPLGGNAPVLCGNSTDSIGCPSGFYCRSGPPDICCPGVDPNAKAVQHGVKVLEETTPLPGQPRSYYKEALLATPTYMCPDASDPLMGSNGSPLMCGAGFDGVQMCPKGYYCAIDGAKGSRLCCPLFGAAQRLPTDSVIAPYFGRRSPNPGEVIDRGSLPSDQENFRKHSSAGRSEEIVTKSTEQPTTTAEADEYDDEDQHLMLKPTDRRHEILQQTAASVSPKASDVEAEAVNIDVPTEAPVPEEVEPTTSKVVMDKSICHMKPTEGRACREDEKPPRTNLHYFYSAKDNRCKLYFYRGCGGNENRFEKKADCEAMCLHA